MVTDTYIDTAPLIYNLHKYMYIGMGIYTCVYVRKWHIFPLIGFIELKFQKRAFLAYDRVLLPIISMVTAKSAMSAIFGRSLSAAFLPR